VDAIRRGLEAIRGVDPNRPISLAAPESVADYAKELAVKYGGFFHNTGYMSAWFGDLQPRMMNSVGLPASAEPGGPAQNLAELKNMFELITLEGVDSYNYFITIGSVMWDPEMKAWFDSQQPMVHLLGKYHLPATRVAGLAGMRSDRLTGWPWVHDEATDPSGGYWGTDVSGQLNVPADLLSERDVMNGMLSKYDLVYDEQTSIMSRELVQKISDWVKAGGTFVTLAQTGRHTEEEPDSWPISALTNCDVLWMSKVKGDTGEYEWQPFTMEPGELVFDEAYWGKVNKQANGLGLKPRGADVTPLVRWKNDGSLAVGLRQVGKGRVFIVGLKFTNDRPWWGAPEQEAKFVNDILAYCGYQNQDDARVGGKLISGQTWLHDEGAPGRHFISNNGLYDVYFVCNTDKQAQEMSVSLPGTRSAPWAWDVAAGQEVAGVAADGRLNFPVGTLQHSDLRALLVPRGQISQAPADWLRLQTGWWQGGGAPGTVLTPDTYNFVEDLTAGWTLTPAADDQFSAPAGQPIKNLGLGPWTYLVKEPVKNATFSRDFTVPAAWKDGNVYLHVASWVGGAFLDKGRVLLDDKELRGFNENGVELMLNDTLKAGTKHSLALQIKGGPYSQGTRASVWLEYEPRPTAELSLAGPWEPSADALTRTARVQLPGVFEGRMARATIFVPADWQGKQEMIHALGGPNWPALLYVITNGKMCRRHHHIYGPRLDLNITPYLKFGAPNEIEIVANSTGKVQVAELSLRAYAPELNYP
jgi:hypothetical protein